MKLYTTMINGLYCGKRTLPEIKKWEREAREIAANIRKEKNPDHVIYAYYEYDENNDIQTAYINISEKTEEEYDRISRIPNYRICALHKR